MFFAFQNMSLIGQNYGQNSKLPFLDDHPPGVDISNIDFHNTMWLLAQAMTVQPNQQVVTIGDFISKKRVRHIKKSVLPVRMVVLSVAVLDIR